ncbi:MAG: methylmalonyl-CoA epimerase [Candidatus Nitrosocaldaceae archaeon]|nr:MAG: methylmalonyl-CoA epimerase [Candidatus Nitrosocaldaceae archaeon]
MKVDHIAIAVNNVEESLKTFEKVLRVKKKEVMDVPNEKVKVAMLELDNSRIELLEPLSDDSPISKFLKDRGEGIHHIAINTEKFDDDLNNAINNGIKIIGGVREGSYGRKITFIHPKSLHGVLMELCEPHD